MKAHLKYLQLDYVPNPAQTDEIPWVIVAVDPANPGDAILVHEIEACGPWIEAQDRDYLDALLAEWKQTLNKDGNELLESLSGLVIGPLRSSKSDQCEQGDLDTVTQALCAQARNSPHRNERDA